MPLGYSRHRMDTISGLRISTPIVGCVHQSGFRFATLLSRQLASALVLPDLELVHLVRVVLHRDERRART
jgi:hypothetical protein